MKNLISVICWTFFTWGYFYICKWINSNIMIDLSVEELTTLDVFYVIIYFLVILPLIIFFLKKFKEES